MQRVMDVTDVNIFIGKSNPPQLTIHAEGKVPTTGWSHPTLNPRMYVTTPADLVQDFDFCANEPTGLALNIICPIVAVLRIEMDVSNYWGTDLPLKGVRIHAHSGSMEAGLDKDRLTDDFVPWPWKHIGSAHDNLDALVGCPLRVYHESDPLTDDHIEDRVNI
jgi:hypothetical protein